MKPCPRNRQLIVWMSLDALDTAAVRQLRAHLETCPGCRQYWHEVAAVSREQTQAAAALPEVAADEFFHQRLKQRIAADAERPVLSRKWEAIVRQITWPWKPPVAVAISALIVIIGFVWLWTKPPAGLPSPHNGAAMNPPGDQPPAESRPPTLAHYRAVANASLEEFDELLTRLAARPSSFHDAPAYTALRRSDPDN